MRWRLLIPAVLCLGALLATAAHGEQRLLGNVWLRFGGDFAPHLLPRDRLAPIEVRIDGSIGTTDGSHPPALRRLEIKLNGHGRLTTRGLPACSAPLLQSTSTDEALARCRPALVGRGSFKADVSVSDQGGIPAKGAILAFNGSRGGHRLLLLHIYGTVPVRATFVLPLTIEHKGEGEFGNILSAGIPTLAGGLGSITEIRLRLRRLYSYRGERLSYLSASCAAPPGFRRIPFSFARGIFSFADGRKTRISLVRVCRVRG
jgi:hypothetical protein